MLDLRTELNENTCYVKPVLMGHDILYAVHTNMGQQVSLFATRDLAFATAHIHDLTPMSLH